MSLNIYIRSVLCIVILFLWPFFGKGQTSNIYSYNPGEHGFNDGLMLYTSIFPSNSDTLIFHSNQFVTPLEENDINGIPGSSPLRGIRWDIKAVSMYSDTQKVNFLFSFWDMRTPSYNPNPSGLYYLVHRTRGSEVGTKWILEDSVYGYSVDSVVFRNVSIPPGDQEWTIASPSSESILPPPMCRTLSVSLNESRDTCIVEVILATSNTIKVKMSINDGRAYSRKYHFERGINYIKIPIRRDDFQNIHVVVDQKFGAHYEQWMN